MQVFSLISYKFTRKSWRLALRNILTTDSCTLCFIDNFWRESFHCGAIWRPIFTSNQSILTLLICTWDLLQSNKHLSQAIVCYILFDFHYADIICKVWDVSKRFLCQPLKIQKFPKIQKRCTVAPLLLFQINFRIEFQSTRRIPRCLILKVRRYSWQHINESKLLHTYVMNEFLAASCSSLTKCFWKTLYQNL